MQNITKPFQGADMPHLDGANRDAQYGRDVRVPQLFQIAQNQHLAVVRRQPVQSSPHAAP